MAYSQSLAARVRQEFAGKRGMVEKKMFGGVGFLLHGSICVGVWQQSLIARVGPAAYADALQLPHAAEFDITGRPMKGWVMVEPDGIDTTSQLQAWLARAIDFVQTLPPKAK